MTEHCLSLCRLTLGATLLLTNGTSLGAQAAAPGGTAKHPPFLVCNGTYALCTKAKCAPFGEGFSCSCDVEYDPKQTLSAGAYSQKCESVPLVKPIPGMSIPSRYYPIKSYEICPPPKSTGTGPWAMCLDVTCVVGNDTSKAQCSCLKETAVPYVLVTESYNPSGCEEMISSATVQDVDKITHFLKSPSSQLKPFFPIKVVEPPK